MLEYDTEKRYPNVVLVLRNVLTACAATATVGLSQIVMFGQTSTKGQSCRRRAIEPPPPAILYRAFLNQQIRSFTYPATSLTWWIIYLHWPPVTIEIYEERSMHLDGNL